MSTALLACERSNIYEGLENIVVERIKSARFVLRFVVYQLALVVDEVLSRSHMHYCRAYFSF